VRAAREVRAGRSEPGAAVEKCPDTQSAAGHHNLGPLACRADPEEEFYAHPEDPGEWSNLEADPAHSQVKAEMLDWLRRIIRVER